MVAAHGCSLRPGRSASPVNESVPGAVNGRRCPRFARHVASSGDSDSFTAAHSVGHEDPGSTGREDNRASDSLAPAVSETGTVAVSVLDRVRAQAQASGDRVALADRTSDTGGAVTYAELVARADGLAARLRECGVGPDEPVTVLLERSVDSIVAMLAVLVAGGVYC